MNNDLIHINTLPPFKRMCVSIGNLPSSFMESMTYYEALEWLYNYLDKTVIPAINTEGEAITELQTAFITLKNYVDNYFENLDVQEEINNKLDEMAESGQLTDIIAQYLGLAGVLAFNTVNDMKNATNLVNGSTCKTLGFYDINDDGGALYKIRNITNEDIIDNMTIIALNNEQLIAELVINDDVNIKQLGAKNDNTIDCTPIIIKALSICNIVKIPNGTYKITDEIIINESQTLIGEKENTILQFYGNGNCLVVNGRFISIKNLRINADSSIVSNNKVGIVVNPNVVSESSRSTYTNIIIESCMLNGFNKGISLDIMWQVTIRNCIIIGAGKGSDDNRTNYGIEYVGSGTVLTNWSGSGNIIESTYITNCSYGLYIKGGWNITSIDNIIEGVWCSIYVKSTFRIVFINNWFESNEVQPTLDSPIIIMGGRIAKLSDGTTDEFPNNLNNLHLIWNNGDTHNRYNQKLFSDIANEEAILTGVKNQVSTSGTTKITTLKAFTSRGNAITTDENLSNNNLTGELSIVAHGTTGGNSGKTYTHLEYSAGQTDGNNIDIALRPVFEVNKDGSIRNPSLDDTADIGESQHKYKFVWCRNVIVKGDDGNYYKLGVDASGNPKASRI